MSIHLHISGTHTERRHSEIFLVGWTDAGMALEEINSKVILLEKPQLLNIFKVPSDTPELAL